MALHVRIKTPKELPRETEIHGPVVPFYWNLAAFLISFFTNRGAGTIRHPRSATFHSNDCVATGDDGTYELDAERGHGIVFAVCRRRIDRWARFGQECRRCHPNTVSISRLLPRRERRNLQIELWHFIVVRVNLVRLPNLNRAPFGLLRTESIHGIDAARSMGGDIGGDGGNRQQE